MLRTVGKRECWKKRRGKNQQGTQIPSFVRRDKREGKRCKNRKITEQILDRAAGAAEKKEKRKKGRKEKGERKKEKKKEGKEKNGNYVHS